MLFRSRRSSTGAVSPRQSTAFVATVGNFAPAGVPTPAFERPSSAPVAGAVPLQPASSAPGYANVKSDDAQSVEDRLSIVKRSRTTSSAKAATTRESSSAGMALRSPELAPHTADASLMGAAGQPSALPSMGVSPPCSSYPTFSLAKLPKHEQHVMDALMREFTEVLFFSKSE